MRKIVWSSVIGLLAVIVITSLAFAQTDSAYKVLVVMGYHEDFFWNQEVREGLDATLSEQCDLTYFYLDTLAQPEGIEARAAEAYNAYQELQPDAVIAADDDAQVSFVLPYLKDQVETPVIFCGVNADPAEYGYPASNVSGILQRPHLVESITFLRQLVPSVKTVGALSLPIPAGTAIAAQMEQEKENYPITLLDFKYVETMQEALDEVETLKAEADALFLAPLGNLLDADGNRLGDDVVYPALAEAFGKPTFTIWSMIVPYGVLCAVTDRGQEQGEVAGTMVLDILTGKTPLTDIPITQNKRGKRILNVDVLKALGIKPQAHILKGVEFVQNAK